MTTKYNDGTIEELETIEFPKRGDKILVSIDGYYWEKSIFLAYIEGAKDPIICVAKDDEELFKHGLTFGICEWNIWKSIPQKKIIKVTKKEIAAKTDIDKVKIAEKK